MTTKTPRQRAGANGSASSADRTIDLTDRILATTDDAVEARLAAIETALGRLQDAVIAGFADLRTQVAGEVDGAMTRLEHANAAVRASFAADLAAVRADLADALVEVRGQVESTVGTANSAIAATLDQHGAAAHSVLEAVEGEVKAGLGEMSRSLANQLGAIRGVTGTLGGSTERLVGAGQALLAYLGERDQWLERERDRVLHDVLEEFAAGLSGRGRRSLTTRMRDVVERRRDSRDAERYRRGQDGAPVLSIPSVPPELAALSEPAVAERVAEPISADQAPTKKPEKGTKPGKRSARNGQRVPGSAAEPH